MLEQNNVLPILKPVLRVGPPRSSHAHQALKGQAAATVKLLEKVGLNRQQALQAVAKELAKLGVRPERGSGTITANTVRHWCDDVAADVGRRGTAAMMCDSMFTAQQSKKFSALPSNRARQRRACALLAHFVLSVFPKRQRKPRRTSGTSARGTG
jgi:hypothetical protein